MDFLLCDVFPTNLGEKVVTGMALVTFPWNHILRITSQNDFFHNNHIPIVFRLLWAAAIVVEEWEAFM